MELRIGDAAALLQMPAHVLRHWEDVGVITPERLPGGHRVYTDETITRARLVRICQRAGMSLQEVRRLFGTEAGRRADVVATHRESLREQSRRLATAEQFLSHVLECQHPLVSECPDCQGFATDEQIPARSRRRRAGALESGISSPRTGIS